MKVAIRFQDQTETVENVSVDDKCLPVVAGLHPYPSSARSSSPFVLESAVWFKTLALEAVYIDCDRRLIYWTPVVNNASGNKDVKLRRSTTASTSTRDFIPATARPLFQDSTIYDFDASLKDMMGQFIEAARKFFKKSQTTEDFHKVIAKILHMYILPSITFTMEDMYCLNRAQCLIEVRLSKSEDDIAAKASSIVNLRNCLNTLKSNLLIREELDSERYLRTCKKDFLICFLKTIESDVKNLNIELTAQQSKVNWAKRNHDDADNICKFQQKRDGLFKEVEKFIRVREAIKNVISRRDLTKRKVQKSDIINSCFHNVFIEIMRRLEIEDRILSQLGNDKVNICATREAVVCTISQIVDNNRNSDRTSKFEPEDLTDFSVSEGQRVKKSIPWLTFQERVARVLEDTSSKAFKVHREGCRDINSKIHLALSEFDLTKKTGYQHHEVAANKNRNPPLSSPPADVTLRRSRVSDEYSNRRKAVAVGCECEFFNMDDHHLVRDVTKTCTLCTLKTSCEASTSQNSYDRRALSTNDIRVRVFENQTENVNNGSCSNLNPQKVRRRASETSLDDILTDDSLSPVYEEADMFITSGLREDEHLLRRQRHIMARQLALSSLMSAVDGLKLQVRSHFREVIDDLNQELSWEDMDKAAVHDHQELLWKSYEKFFCQEVYVPLLKLYMTGLTPAIQKAYATLKKTSLHEILKGDKILDLFFGQKEVSTRIVSILVPPRNKAEDKFSVSRTLESLDVRCCNIKDLYSLANADSDDLRKHFDLDSFECEEEEEDVKTSSEGSSQSTDLLVDEETVEMNSESQSTGAQSIHSSASLDRDSIDDPENLNIHSSMKNVEETLDRVLSPFKKHVEKCLNANCFLDKVRYITKAMEDLNRDISQMIGPDFQSACDDILSMIILALYNLPEDMFVGLYINLRLLIDLQPCFLGGTLWDYNLVTLCASYDFLFTLKVCKLVIKQYPGSFRVKRSEI